MKSSTIKKINDFIISQPAEIEASSEANNEEMDDTVGNSLLLSESKKRSRSFGFDTDHHDDRTSKSEKDSGSEEDSGSALSKKRSKITSSISSIVYRKHDDSKSKFEVGKTTTFEQLQDILMQNSEEYSEANAAAHNEFVSFITSFFLGAVIVKQRDYEDELAKGNSAALRLVNENGKMPLLKFLKEISKQSISYFISKLLNF